jgi:Protein of unknown function (DUF1566)
MKMNEKQKEAIKCALAGLIGAQHAHEYGDWNIHDWKSHQVSIDELKANFPDCMESTPGDLDETTITDPKTELEWKCGYEGRHTFYDAVKLFGEPNDTGFRLPSIDELKTLLDAEDHVKAMLTEHEKIFWSSSRVLDAAKNSWCGLGFNGLIFSNSRNKSHYVRLVRA